MIFSLLRARLTRHSDRWALLSRRSVPERIGHLPWRVKPTGRSSSPGRAIKTVHHRISGLFATNRTARSTHLLTATGSSRRRSERPEPKPRQSQFKRTAKLWSPESQLFQEPDFI